MTPELSRGIPAVIDKMESDAAVIRMDDGQLLRVPRSELPEKARPGERLRILTLVTDTDDASATMARDLLNELLNGT
jgi:hypothetical protein